MDSDEKKKLQKKYLIPSRNEFWSEEERLRRLEIYQKKLTDLLRKKKKIEPKKNE